MQPYYPQIYLQHTSAKQSLQVNQREQKLTNCDLQVNQRQQKLTNCDKQLAQSSFFIERFRADIKHPTRNYAAVTRKQNSTVSNSKYSLPDQAINSSIVFSSTWRHLETCFSCLFWYGNLNNYSKSKSLCTKHTLYLKLKFMLYTNGIHQLKRA